MEEINRSDRMNRIYTSLNAEELHVGDKCFLSDTKKDLDEQIDFFDNDRVRTLTDIRDDTYERRFVDEVKNAYAFAYLVERTPQYRPYENINEMIADWKSRFNNSVPNYAMPLIWLQHTVTKAVSLMTSFLVIDDKRRRFDDLFDNYTYLDGSPFGKKCEVE